MCRPRGRAHRRAGPKARSRETQQPLGRSASFPLGCAPWPNRASGVAPIKTRREKLVDYRQLQPMTGRKRPSMSANPPRLSSVLLKENSPTRGQAPRRLRGKPPGRPQARPAPFPDENAGDRGPSEPHDFEAARADPELTRPRPALDHAERVLQPGLGEMLADPEDVDVQLGGRRVEA